MRNARLLYKKTDRAKYISHLDVNRLMLRAIKRSRIPVWVTEGFNPHIFITFALPLSLGYESQYDYMDFRIIDDSLSFEEVCSALSEALPDCIEAVEVYEPHIKPKEIAFAEFVLYIECDGNNKKLLTDFLNRDELIVEKKTKKGGLKSFDVKPKIFDLSIDDYYLGLKILMRLPAGNDDNINPSVILNAPEMQGIGFSVEKVIRGRLFDKNMVVFH